MKEIENWFLSGGAYDFFQPKQLKEIYELTIIKSWVTITTRQKYA